MRIRFPFRLFAIACACFIAGAITAAAQGASRDYTGQWAGTWDGAGSGSFELLLQKDGDGKPAGKVSVTTEGGNYEAELKSVAIAGEKIDAAYDFPLDPSAEVVMTATVNGATAKGTWLLRPKGGGAEIASGTFALTKK